MFGNSTEREARTRTARTGATPRSAGRAASAQIRLYVMRSRFDPASTHGIAGARNSVAVVYARHLHVGTHACWKPLPSCESSVRIRQEKDELEYGGGKLRLFVRARLIAGEEIAATPGASSLSDSM